MDPALRSNGLEDAVAIKKVSSGCQQWRSGEEAWERLRKGGGRGGWSGGSSVGTEPGEDSPDNSTSLRGYLCLHSLVAEQNHLGSSKN